MKSDRSPKAQESTGPQHADTAGASAQMLLKAQSIPAQLAIGNRGLGQLLQPKIKIPAAGPAKIDTSGSGQGVAQRKIKIAGLTEKKRKNFVAKINDGSALQYELDGSGYLQQVDKKKTAKDEYSKQITTAIADGQEVIINLVSKDDARFIDSFAGGQVDYDDLKDMAYNLFRLNFLHIIVERFSVADYEKNKATASMTDPHKKGLESEERVLKTFFPKKTIKYKGEALDPASKKVDAAGNGSINYEIDFTDVKYVFKQPIESNAVKENIISSKIVVVK